MILLTTLYDEYTKRQKLSEQKKRPEQIILIGQNKQYW